MKFTYRLHISILSILLLVTVGCDISQDNGSSAELEGLYVLNEGNFTDGVATMTVYDPDSDSVEQKAFQNRNGRPLGSVGQSMTQINDLLYAVINNSQKVEVMNATDLQSTGTIELDSLSPRYMIQVREDVGYVTNYNGFTSPGYVSVVDLTTNEVTKLIEVGVTPEQLVRIDNRVYVANGGGNSVSVIDAQTDEVIEQVQTGTQPAFIAVDASTRIWVLSRGSMNGTYGDMSDDTPGKLYMLNANGNKMDSLTISLDLGNPQEPIGAHPSEFAINNDDGVIYLRKAGIHKINMNSLTVSEENFIDRNFYALEYMSREGKRNIYTADAKSFQGAGEAYIYDVEGNAVDSFQTGVGPGDFHFNVVNR